MPELETITNFRDEYAFLSNFYQCYIIYEGLVYPTVEHAYVASKTFDMNFRFRVLEIPSERAGAVKRLGRTIELRPNWEKVKVKIMQELLSKKFNQPVFKNLLLNTYPKKIIEGNLWHDNFWGICQCDKCSSNGKNTLGKLLMDIREELKNGKNIFPVVV